MRGFYTIPIFGLLEAARAARVWIEAPDLGQLARVTAIGSVATGLSMNLVAGDAWLWHYVLFGIFTGALLRHRAQASVPATWVPVLFVSALCAVELCVYETLWGDPDAWRQVLSLTWGGLLAVLAFRYSGGIASGCSTLFGAMIAWFVSTLFIGVVRDLAFGTMACLFGLLLPGPPSWVAPIVDTATQVGFDAAALGVVWLAAAIAQEDAMDGHQPDAGLILKVVRERMLRGDTRL